MISIPLRFRARRLRNTQQEVRDNKVARSTVDVEPAVDVRGSYLAVGVQGSYKGPSKRSVSARSDDGALVPAALAIATSFSKGFERSQRASAVSARP